MQRGYLECFYTPANNRKPQQNHQQFLISNLSVFIHTYFSHQCVSDSGNCKQLNVQSVYL